MTSEIQHIWPKLMRLSEYREHAFTGKTKPDMRRLKKLIDEGSDELPGEVRHGVYCVWVNQYLQPEQPPIVELAKEMGTGIPQADLLAAQIMERVSA